MTTPVHFFSSLYPEIQRLKHNFKIINVHQISKFKVPETLNDLQDLMLLTGITLSVGLLLGPNIAQLAPTTHYIGLHSSSFLIFGC